MSTMLSSVANIAELDVTVKEACEFLAEQQLLLKKQRDWLQGKLDLHAEKLSSESYGLRVNYQGEYLGKKVDNIYRVRAIKLFLKESGGIRIGVDVVRDREPGLGNSFEPYQLIVWPEDDND